MHWLAEADLLQDSKLELIFYELTFITLKTHENLNYVGMCTLCLTLHLTKCLDFATFYRFVITQKLNSQQYTKQLLLISVLPSKSTKYTKRKLIFEPLISQNFSKNMK